MAALKGALICPVIAAWRDAATREGSFKTPRFRECLISISREEVGSQTPAVRLVEFLKEALNAPSMETLDAWFANLIDDWGSDRWAATPILSAARGNVRPFEVSFGKPSRTCGRHYR